MVLVFVRGDGRVSSPEVMHVEAARIWVAWSTRESALEIVRQLETLFL